MTLRTLNYGNYGIFLTMGNAGFCPSTVVHGWDRMKNLNCYSLWALSTHKHVKMLPNYDKEKVGT